MINYKAALIGTVCGVFIPMMFKINTIPTPSVFTAGEWLSGLVVVLVYCWLAYMVGRQSSHKKE